MVDKFVGKRLDGRYEIKEIIGVGGMAVVYKAYDNIEDRIVAVKILKEEFVTNEEFLRRFKNESKAIAVLSHPNIVKVFDVSFGDLIQYIVMEYIDGITLKEYIEQQGVLRWRDAVHFTIQILRALQHAHDKGIVHRDVKPQNIMLLPDGKIKVADFGIARFARNEHQTMTDKAIGSVHYISPEQARGDMTDEKADLYSVGVILYEMITGQLPFQAESAVSVAIMQLQNEPTLPREINPSIPLGLEQITMHAMQKDAQKRYKSAAEMLCDVEEFKRDPETVFEYNCFVDDSPTKYVDEEGNDDNNSKPQKPLIIPILTGVAAAFVIALVVLGIIFLPQLFSATSASYECPSFIGEQYNTLLDNPDYANFTFDEPELVYSNEYEAGIIIDQRPVAGKQLKSSQKIKLTVSMGAKSVIIPDVYDFDVAAASSTLKNLGFTVKVVYSEDDNVAKDRVIKTVPARNNSAPEGSEIELHVSSGAATVYVSNIDLIGLSEATAKKKIEQGGLTVGTVTRVNSTMPEGTVVSQDPSYKSTSKVAKGSSINIEVSNGIPPVVTYERDIVITLPNDLISNTIFINASIDGASIHNSEKIFANDTKSYTFKYSTTKESAVIRIKIKYENGTAYYNYLDIDVNFKNGTQNVVKQYDEYKTAGTSSGS